MWNIKNAIKDRVITGSTLLSYLIRPPLNDEDIQGKPIRGGKRMSFLNIQSNLTKYWS